LRYGPAIKWLGRHPFIKRSPKRLSAPPIVIPIVVPKPVGKMASAATPSAVATANRIDLDGSLSAHVDAVALR